MRHKAVLLVLILVIASGFVILNSSGDKFSPEEYSREEIMDDGRVVPSEGEVAFIYGGEDGLNAEILGETYEEDRVSAVESEEGFSLLVGGKVAFSYEDDNETWIRYGDRKIRGYEPFKSGDALGYINYSWEMWSERYPDSESSDRIPVLKPHSIKYTNGTSTELPEVVQENASKIFVHVSNGEPYLEVEYHNFEEPEIRIYRGVKEVFKDIELDFRQNNDFKIVDGDIYQVKEENRSEVLYKNEEPTDVKARSLSLVSLKIYDGETYISGFDDRDILLKGDKVIAEYEGLGGVSSLTKTENRQGYTEGSREEKYVVIGGQRYGPFESARVFQLGDRLVYEAEMNGDRYLYRPDN